MAAESMDLNGESDSAQEKKEENSFAENEENFSTKHQLQCPWTLWYDNSKLLKENESWEASLKNIMTFDTVEDFWCLHGNIMPASRLQIGSNYSIFKEGIKPMWEDTANVLGGKWTFTINKPDRKNLDTWWLHSVLAVIGGILEIESNDEICGIVVSIRKSQDRIALWTHTASSMETQHLIGTKFRDVLSLPNKCPLKYLAHDEALQAGYSSKNKSYVGCIIAHLRVVPSLKEELKKHNLLGMVPLIIANAPA